MIGALIRKFWPGWYTSPEGVRRLATTWADYQATIILGFPIAADAVITKFWVRHISRVFKHVISFISDENTMLTHDSQLFLCMIEVLLSCG